MYLDPGSGSVIIQVIIGGLLGITVALRLFWSRIKTSLGGKAKPTQVETENEWTKES